MKSHRTNKNYQRSRKRKQTSVKHLFNRYQKEGNISRSRFKYMLQREWSLKYNQNVLNACYHIWFERKNGTFYLTFSTFQKMFQKPDGFLRDISVS